MMNLTFLTQRDRRATASGRQNTSNSRRRASGRKRPGLENLECRALLTTMFVDHLWSGASSGDIVGEGLTFGENAFSTIPLAIAAASEGDEVRIAKGTYAFAKELRLNYGVSLIGSGVGETIIDVSATTSPHGINVRADDVSLSGFTMTGAKSNTTLTYGINLTTVNGVSISDVVVESTYRTGINLNGANDTTMHNVVSRNTGGAGVFFVDGTGLTLNNVQTEGNAWMGVAFATSGRYNPIGVSGVVITGASRFGEVEDGISGVAFEEGRWNANTSSYDLSNPVPITFSTNLDDQADVTFLQDVPLSTTLTGPQSGSWPIRWLFYETAEQGLAAAAGSPTHFLDHGRQVLLVGEISQPRTFLVSEALSIQTALAAANPGDTIQILAGTHTISSVLTLNKSVNLVGEGKGESILNVAGSSSAHGLNVTANDVTLSGFSIVGSTSNTTLRYGINASGVAGLSISDVDVTSTYRTGVNLNGTTNASIANVSSRDSLGAGFFFVDVKGLTLTDVQTSGNAWTGAAFSTSGRYHAVGVQGVVISGASRFGEVESDNGGVMFEEGRWDSVARAYDLENPVPITFSTKSTDGADVTFLQDVALGVMLTGPQDPTDSWPSRLRFYETIEQGLAAADGSPDHFLPDGRVLSAIEGWTPALGIAGSSSIPQGSPYGLELLAGQEVGPISSWEIDWGDGSGLTSTADGGTHLPHVYDRPPGVYTIRAWAYTALGRFEAQNTITVDVQNVNPIVSIVEDPGSVAQGTAVALTAYGVDHGETLSYTWVVSLGGTQVASGAGDAFTFTPTIPGSYEITLTGADGYGGTSVATAVVSVQNVNPIVSIVEDPGSVDQGTAVALTAIGSDPGGAVSFAWAASLGGVVVATGEGATFTFTPTVPGFYEITLTGADGHGGTSVATAIVSVQNVNPIVSIVGAPESVAQGTAVALTAYGVDHGETLSYTWVVSLGGTQVASGTADAFTFSPAIPGSYEITLTGADGYGGTSVATAIISVQNVNPAVSIVGAPGSVDQGTAIALSAIGSDAGGEVSYTWAVILGGALIASGEGGVIAFTPTTPGEYVVVLTGVDEHGGSAVASTAITVLNVAPTVTIDPIDGSVDVGTVVTLSAHAVDPNPAVTPTYAWTVQRNSSVVAQAQGPLLNFSPFLSGAYQATVVVSDGEGGVTSSSIAFNVVSSLPATVEQAVETQIERASVQAAQQIQQQEQRLVVIYERYGESPPPTIQRMIQRVEQSIARIEQMAIRRVALIERTFSRMARRSR